jgi:aminocarboxymuconate-semialdehyde decarboxylase
MARRFFYDTILYDPAALRFLAEMIGEDRILVGSDYPFSIKQDRPERFARQALGLTADVFAANTARFLQRAEGAEKQKQAAR